VSQEYTSVSLKFGPLTVDVHPHPSNKSRLTFTDSYQRSAGTAADDNSGIYLSLATQNVEDTVS
jgi:hypothetical protein